VAARVLGAERAANSAEELIADPDIDVIHICTPNHLHVDLATAVIASGKHVICEKPLALDVEDAQLLVEAAAARGVVAVVPFIYRFYPTVRDARERVRSGRSGPLRLLHGSYLQDWLSRSEDENWRIDSALGGASRAFADIGVHWCDLVEFSSGHRITELSATLMKAHSQRGSGKDIRAVNTEDAAVVSFRTDKGAVGSVVVSQISAGRKNRLWFSLDGDDESLVFDQEVPDSLWVGSRDEITIVPRGSTGAVKGPWNVLPAGHPQGYLDSFSAFMVDTFAAINGEVRDGLPTFRDGLRAAEITATVLRSAASGSWETVK
jgi:predicted dehydrogenase